MAKSRNAQIAAERRKREAAALKAAGGSRYLASYRHHKARAEAAAQAHDYATLRDAENAMADLRPYLRAGER